MVNLYRYTSNANIGAKVASTVIDTFDYTNSSMLYVMADALANIFHGAYFIIAPFYRCTRRLYVRIMYRIQHLICFPAI